MTDDNGDAQRALVKRAAPIAQSLRPQTFGELVQFADRAARSSMVPAAYRAKPDDIVLAVQMGSEIGLAPMQALQNIAVIGGRPAIFGDAMSGLCRQSAVCDDIEEWFEGDGDSLTAFCKATRSGKKPVVQKFSVADARNAGLWDKTGPWKQYPRRMLQMRARGFALRDAFPDVLRGLISAEEAQDIPPEQPFSGTTLEGEPSPVTPPSAPMTPPQTSRPATAIVDEIEAKARAATSAEDLDQLERDDDVRRVREVLPVGRPQRDRMDALFAFHRKLLRVKASQPSELPEFEAILLDEFGEALNDGQPYLDASTFAREAIRHANSIPVSRMEEFETMNAEAFAAIREGSHDDAARILSGLPVGETTTEGGAGEPRGTQDGPPTLERLVAPVVKGKPSWTAYVQAFRAAINTMPPPLISGWLALQEPVLRDCPLAQRMQCVAAVNETCMAARVPTPQWIATLLASAPPRVDADQAWVDDIKAELAKVSGIFDVQTAEEQLKPMEESHAIRQKLDRLKANRPLLHAEIETAFKQARSELLRRRDA